MTLINKTDQEEVPEADVEAIDKEAKLTLEQA